MKTFSLFSLCLALAMTGTPLLAANSLTISPSVNTYAGTGGNVTFTVTLGYTDAMAGIGVDFAPPSGWKFVSVGGANPPAIVPSANDLGPFSFNYQSIPTGPATFTFALSYPAGKTGNQVFTGSATFAAESGSTAAVNLAAITLSPAATATPPTVTVNRAAAQADPASSLPINFTVVFSETVTGFDASDVIVSSSAGAVTKSVTGSGATYNVALTGLNTTGSVTVSVPAGGAQNAAGLANTASTSTDATVNFQPPPPVLIPTAGQVSIVPLVDAGQFLARVQVGPFSTGGYAATWGNPVITGTTITLDAQLTAPAAGSVGLQVITTLVHDYPLGPLAAGSYTVVFKASGQTVTSAPLAVFSLATAANPAVAGSVAVNPTGVAGARYLGGSAVALTATAAAEAQFLNWSGDATGTVPTVTVNMNANQSVVANFSTTPATLPTVTTGAVTQITSAAARVEGTVVADGGATVVERGYVFSADPNPTLSSGAKLTDGAGVGTFASTLTTFPLTPNTTYFMRAYATNSVGTAYGDERVFTTDPTLRAYYRFDGSAQDLSGNGVHANATGGVTYEDGKTGKGVKFDGATGYLNVANRALDSIEAGDYTLALWVKSPTAFTTQTVIMQKQGTTPAGRNVGWFLNTHPGHSAYYTRYVMSGDQLLAHELHGTRPIDDGQWHHIAVVRSGNTLAMYIDGAASATTPTIAGEATNTFDLGIGRSNPSANSYFAGALDEFRYYGRALSSGEIGALAGNGAVALETIDFANGLPAGWTAWPNNSGNRDFANGRMNAYQVDATHRIFRAFVPPAGATAIELKYRANIASGAVGGGNYIVLGFGGSVTLQVSHGWGDLDGGSGGTQMDASTYIGDTLLRREFMARAYEAFDYTITLRDGQISHKATRLNGEVVFNYTTNAAGVTVAGLNRIDLALYQTVMNPLWMDDVQISAVLGGSSGAGADIVDGFDNLDTNSTWEVVGGTWTVSGGKVTGTWSQSAALTDQGNLLLRQQNLDGDFDATMVTTVATGSGAGFSLYAGPGSKMNVNLAPTTVVVERRVNASAGTPYTVIAESTYAGSASSPTTFKLTRRGALIAVYANGAKILEFSDATWNGRLRVGLKVYGTSSFDSFEYHPVAATGSVLYAADFNDNQTPTGWSLVRVNNSGNAGVRNGRFEVNPTDSYGYLSRPLTVASNVTRIRANYTARLDAAYWGMGSTVRLGLSDGSGVIAGAGKAGWGENAINVSLGYDDGNNLVRQVAPGFGTYRFTADFTDGNVRLRAESAVDGSVLFDQSKVVSGFTLQQVSEIRFFQFTTTDVTGWIDDIAISLSDGATLVAPAIVTQPQTQVVTAGANVTLTTTATGSPAPAYQWRKNGTAIAGATSATLALTGVQYAEAASYDVLVTNAAGSVTSDPAKIYVGQAGATYRLTAPLAETADHLSAVQAQFGATATLADWNEIKAAYGANLAAFYQMVGLANGFEAMVTVGGTAFYGSTRHYYLQRFESGPYSGFLAHDQSGTLYLGSWYGFSMPVVAKVGGTAPPTIVTQPHTQIAGAGGPVTLSIVVTGATSYQWRKNGTAIAGATSASFVLTAAQFGDSGVFDCVVTNAGGARTSDAARVYIGQTGATYRLTAPLSETADLAAAVQSQFGAGATLADWAEIKVAYGGNLNAFYQMIGLGNGLEAMVTLNGNHFYGGNRHYYLQRFDSTPYSGFLAHDQSGTLYLGSWYGFTLPVVAKVVESSPAGFVSRTLPAFYVPGQDVTVALQAEPGATVSTYAVQDGYPAGWTVKSVGTGGAHDTQNKLIKFGPFFDHEPRTLTYVVTAPAAAAGAVAFSGLGSADGVNSAIGGAGTLSPPAFHPADNNPADSRMGISEVTAYGAAWKRGDVWPLPPNPIEISYVTRAGFLWKNGETYTLDSSVATAPLWWVNSAAAMAREGPLAALPEATVPASTSVRSVSGTTVTVTVTPDAAIGVYAVEDVVPAGLTVSNITGGGAFDTVNRKVKWGPFFDNSARTLTYAIAGANGTYVVSGVASFDGTNVTTVGTTGVTIGATTTAPVIGSSPVNQTATAGGTISFTATGTGTPSPTYQWQRQPAAGGGFANLVNGGVYSGATSSTLTLTGVTDAMHGDQFRVVASNGVAPDATSNAATLTVNVPPAFTSLPQVVFVTGQANSFTFTASGRPAPTFTVSAGTLPAWAAFDGTTGVLSGTPPNATGSPFNFTIGASNTIAPNATQPFTLTVQAPTVPTITVQPVSRTAAVGAPVTFSVTASGTAPLTYQWRKNGSAVASGTASSLTFGSVQMTDTGAYSVVVSNGAGSVTSNVATLGVIPPGSSATHAVNGSGYVAGNTVTINNTFTYTGTATSLAWRVLLPAGWSYVSGSGMEGDVKPAPGTIEVLEWAWTAAPTSPVTFSYVLNVPSGQTGAKDLIAVAILRQGEAPIEMMVQPDPLTLSQVTTHAADTNRDGRISLLELTRVIELYNTKNGTNRTGAYQVQEGTEDGFAADSVRSVGQAATLTRYHSADTGIVSTPATPNGAIDLAELTRVIALYNYRVTNTRTGEYHVHPGSEDGFNPGPLTVHPAQ